MQFSISRYRSAIARIVIDRALVLAMSLGPVVGAMLAFGSVAAQDAASLITIDRSHSGEVVLAGRPGDQLGCDCG